MLDGRQYMVYGKHYSVIYNTILMSSLQSNQYYSTAVIILLSLFHKWTLRRILIYLEALPEDVTFMRPRRLRSETRV